MPALVITVATHMTVAGTVATAVSQAVIIDDATEIPRTIQRDDQ